MDVGSSIFVAGHRGLVGSALVRALRARGYRRVLTRGHDALDLTRQAEVEEFFSHERPDYVFLAAAKVGGIAANNTLPAEFIHANLAIQTHVIDAAWRHHVKGLLFLGSSCIYPRACPQPIRESYLLTGPLEATNRPYAVAKIAGIEQCWAYNRQYGTRFLCVMPTNLYGPGDNYDLATSHVLPALLRKIHEAKLRGDAAVEIWGSGTPRREFLYSDDLADACIHLLVMPPEDWAKVVSDDEPPLVNIGYGADLTIRELALLIAETVGFRGELRQDPSRPDGTPRKLLDIERMRRFGWSPSTALSEGIARVYRDLLTHHGAA
jgi:GDP-L-fucose synthase